MSIAIPKVSRYQLTLGQWMTDAPYELNEIIRLQEVYGNIFRLKRKHIMVTDAELIGDILADDVGKFYRKIPSKLSAHHQARNRRTDKQELAQLTAVERLQVGSDSFSSITKNFIEQLTTQIINSNPTTKSSVIDLNIWLARLVLPLLAELILGIDLTTNLATDQLDKLFTSIKTVNHYDYKPSIWPLWMPTFSNIMFSSSMTYIDELLKERARRYPSQNSQLSSLQQILSTAIKQGKISPLTNKSQLWLDHAKGLLIWSTEKIVNSLLWSLALLMIDHQFYADMVKQIDSIEQAIYLTSEPLILTRALVLESLRMYPPVWIISRQAVRKHLLQEHKIQHKASIYCHIYGLHRNPDYWDDPDVFDPSRFLIYDDNESTDIVAGSYLPFGDGAHSCVAADFSVELLTLLIANLNKHFRFSFVDKKLIRIKLSRSLRANSPAKVLVKLR